MRGLAFALFILVALINLTPGLGVLSATRMEALYGVPLAEANLAILMRHRAVMLAIVGALLAFAAFRPALRPVAVAAGLVSMLSFVAIAWLGKPNALLQRVSTIDVIGSVLLVAAAVADHVSASRPGPQ
jgi:hypothetical protein